MVALIGQPLARILGVEDLQARLVVAFKLELALHLHAVASETHKHTQG